MQVCRKCKATWPDALVDDWGTHQESAGLGPDPVCPALVPVRGQHAASGARQACGGALAFWEDAEEAGQLLLLSPHGDDNAREKAQRHNAARLDALRQGK
jgi:hypothetical protein